jgi:putative ABC transport system permease protein
MSGLLARLRAWLRRDAHDRDFGDELDAHFEMLVEDHVRRGLAPDEARRVARVRLGNAASLGEQHRRHRGLPGLDTVLQDLWFACRVLVRGPRFSVAAIVALALGIGANTVGFAIVYAALIRTLPFDAADDLHVVSWNLKSGRRANASVADLEQWRADTRTFEGLAGYASAVVNLSDDRDLPEQVQATSLTADAFTVLRQPPLAGRDFTAADAQPGVDPVIIIGARLWRLRYGADPAALGRIVRVNGRPATIVGVMPDGMAFPESSEIWMPFVPTEAQRLGDARPLRVFGRRRADTAAAAAGAELNAIAAGMIAASPDRLRDVNGVRVETFQTRFIGGAGRPMFITVLGAVSFVLLIACANVANLLLSRGSERAREIAVRAALGASRARIVRQLLIESVVLAAVGAAAGLLLASVALPVFASQMAPSLPYWVRFEIDGLVFGYVVGVCLVTTLIFGLAPALEMSRRSGSDVLKDGGRGATAGRRARRASAAIVVAQIALTLTLLVGAGVMIRSFVTLYFIDIGIPVDGLVTMRVQLPASKYASADARREFFDRLAPRVRSIPGVEAAAVTDGVPPIDGGERYIEVDGRGPASPTMVGTVTITPEFFDVVQAPIRRGRGFEAGDGAPGSAHVIVNAHFAQRFFGEEDPLGQRIRFTVRDPAPGAPGAPWRTIVGVSPDIGQGSSLDEYVNAVVYIPYRQEAPSSASLLLRSRLPPATVMTAVRRDVQALDPDQPVHSLRTVSDLLAGDRWWQRTWGSVFGIVAAIALVLSSVGLYAVISYAVAQRTQEIGVRMAIGAAPSQIVWLVLRRGLGQIAWGLVIGAAASVALARVMPGGLQGMSAYDPVALACIVALLAAVSVAACVLPARRATRVDPVVALRVE